MRLLLSGLWLLCACAEEPAEGRRGEAAAATLSPLAPPEAEVPRPPVAAEPPRLRLPDGTVPRRFHGELLECAGHGVWSAPDGWDTVAVDGAVVAVSPDRTGAIGRVYGPRGDLTPARALAEALAGVELELREVAVRSPNRWRTVRTLETLDDATVHARIEHGHPGGLPREGAWAQVWVDGADREALDAARASWLHLMSHACACGYDCSRRRAP